MKCGLLGESLKHSYSPQIHSLIADYPYDLFQVKSDNLQDFFTKSDFTGINVTIPHKKAVLPYCSQLSDCAKKLGSVNTIVRLDDGSLYGHNTDYFGFSYLIKHANLHVTNKKALVLGSGGASVTVVAVLEELGADVTVISRTGENNYANISRHQNAALIVNTTPVGMYPENGCSPVDLSQFSQLECVIDIIYNPMKTKLLLDAESHGIKTENGLRMLVAQAVESAKLFTKKEISDDVIEKIFQVLAVQTENIILIGMPGCGKTTIGTILAKKLNRPFVDTDDQIEKAAGMSIPNIFEKFGETEFRKMETAVISDTGKRSGLLISTGGGCVTVAENYAYLHQNGLIVWLQRDIERLTKDGRPISLKTDLAQLFQQRSSMYQRFADITVCNDGEPEMVADKIIKEVEKWSFK